MIFTGLSLSRLARPGRTRALQGLPGVSPLPDAPQQDHNKDTQFQPDGHAALPARWHTERTLRIFPCEGMTQRPPVALLTQRSAPRPAATIGR